MTPASSVHQCIKMPVYQLTDNVVFPPPALATEEGLLAIGGDLSQERLLLAYRNGIFPWFGEGDPILWWSPDPRMVLFPEEFRVSRRLSRIRRSGRFRMTMDAAFDQIIDACATVPRPGQDGTWITADMLEAYRNLHRSGFAHSVECWEGETLAGGLYGLSLGQCFFGESMFSNVANTSKLAMWALVEQIKRWDFALMDCQIYTEHLASLGARCITLETFEGILTTSAQEPSRIGNWSLDNDIAAGSIEHG